MMLHHVIFISSETDPTAVYTFVCHIDHNGGAFTLCSDVVNIKGLPLLGPTVSLFLTAAIN